MQKSIINVDFINKKTDYTKNINKKLSRSLIRKIINLGKQCYEIKSKKTL